jgi:gliding motility-associated-like protein
LTSGNYTISYVNGQLTINKAPLTVTAADKSKAYDGLVYSPFTVTYSGFVNGETSAVLGGSLTFSGTAATAINPGSYIITPAGLTSTNYTITFANGQLTINKAPLTVTADDKNKTYDGSVFNPFTATYTGFVNGETSAVLVGSLTFSGTAVTATSPGTYIITPGGLTAANYNITFVNGQLTINKALLTITAANKSKNYDGLVYNTFTATYSGFVNGETSAVLGGSLTFSGTAITAINAGTYIITPGGLTSGNYTFNYINGQLTINKVNLTFTADNKSRTYQAQNPVLTYTVSGFVNSETQSVLDVPPSLQTTAVQNSSAGSYPITVSGGSDNDYNYIYVAGTLSITKISQTITFTDVPDKLLITNSYTLVATSTSGLPALFESKDVTLATISGDLLTGVSKGNVQIRAYNSGDQNYNAAETFATVEIYSTHKDIMHLFTPNNDGINDFWELPDLAVWGKCDVKVYNRWGKLVFEDPNYNNLWDGTSNGAPLPEGPYYFIIKTENAGVVKGTVNIVR